MTPALQEEVQALQKRMTAELQPLVLESSLTMQKILEAEDHKARCRLLKYFMDAERKRLESKRTLQGIFASGSDSIMETNDDTAKPVFPAEEMVSSSDDVAKKLPKDLTSPSESQESASFFDDEDAFQ